MLKRCTTCNRTFTDRNLSFCIDDGTPLVSADTPADEVTQVSPSQPGATEPVTPPYQPPGGYVPPGGTQSPAKRKVWPWVLGILALLLLLLVGMAIAAAIFIPKMLREAANNNNSSVNANVNRPNRTSNRNTTDNTNDNSNDNTLADELQPPPTDEHEVLGQLTDLENEWTAANVNADKKKLDRILADDYVGSDAQGKTHGKAEYIKTIERDASIQEWFFDDLKVDLKDDRAALSGIIRLKVNDKPVLYRFTDKFVWRDGRWQAIASEVMPQSQT